MRTCPRCGWTMQLENDTYMCIMCGFKTILSGNWRDIDEVPL